MLREMSDEREPVPATPSPEQGRLERARTRAERWTARGQAAMLRLEHERPRHATVETAFRCVIRDKRIAGGVLGGGLAYRLFFWGLGMVLLVSGGLGIAWHSGTAVGQDAKDVGLGSAVAHSVTTAARESQAARWWLVLAGIFLSLWFSYGVLRALRLVHSAAWQILPPPPRNVPKAVFAVLATPVIALLLSTAAGWMRANTSALAGLVVTLLVTFGFVLIALVVSMRLPSRDVPWTAFIPGAVALGIGIEALHIFTVYFLAHRLANASELYGTLGLGATALFYFYLIGRGIVWAAVLNAISWDVRHPGSGDELEARPLFPNL